MKITLGRQSDESRRAMFHHLHNTPIGGGHAKAINERSVPVDHKRKVFGFEQLKHNLKNRRENSEEQKLIQQAERLRKENDDDEILKIVRENEAYEKEKAKLIKKLKNKEISRHEFNAMTTVQKPGVLPKDGKHDFSKSEKKKLDQNKRDIEHYNFKLYGNPYAEEDIDKWRKQLNNKDLDADEIQQLKENIKKKEKEMVGLVEVSKTNPSKKLDDRINIMRNELTRIGKETAEITGEDKSFGFAGIGNSQGRTLENPVHSKKTVTYIDKDGKKKQTTFGAGDDRDVIPTRQRRKTQAQRDVAEELKHGGAEFNVLFRNEEGRIVNNKNYTGFAGQTKRVDEDEWGNKVYTNRLSETQKRKQAYVIDPEGSGSDYDSGVHLDDPSEVDPTMVDDSLSPSEELSLVMAGVR